MARKKQPLFDNEQHSLKPLTGFGVGLVGHHAHCLAIHASKADNDVLGVAGHDLKEVPLVHYGLNDMQNIVGLVRGVRDDVVQPLHQSVPTCHMTVM